ncbi:DUF2786 domain-containing protein [Algiphilus sp.]|uniref:DUF2786 domain-containing protein n=1 Tax=Algiphilus sp. TaxID=1872431 RepID=UPI0025C29013|nr:DUF2786 domain-containing protein [Algiphilus sp.]MCK5772023.1 DUF2786 domain-containing protein [Algiphilus sp.]
MTRAEAIKRVQKCLALSNSGNEHEAATALRQARALMRAHNIGEAEVQAAYATEARAASGSDPRGHIVLLARTVADAFACDTFRACDERVFVGVDPKPEIAAYAFSVLVRKLERDRAAFVTGLKRCKRATKIRRGRVFAEGWVRAVRAEVRSFAGTEADQKLIAAYKSVYHPVLVSVEAKSTKIAHRDADAAVAGIAHGSQVRLQNAVRSSDRPDAISGGSRS